MTMVIKNNTHCYKKNLEYEKLNYFKKYSLEYVTENLMEKFILLNWRYLNKIKFERLRFPQEKII